MKRDEQGAALLLALIFVLILSVGLTIMLDFMNNGFKLSHVVHDKRGMQYAAEGAIEADINAVRGQLVGFTDVPCPGLTLATAAVAINGVDIRVDCTYSPGLVQTSVAGWGISRTRDLIFTACPAATNPCLTTSSTKIAEAEVVFGDVPSLGSTATATAWTTFK